MATVISVNCPECKKKLKVPADARGKKVRCTGCKQVFPVPAAGAKATKPGGKVDDDESDGKPYGVTTLDLSTRCPHCANEMEEGDRVCLTCGYDTVTREFHRTRKLYDVTGTDIFLWLLPGILSALAVFGLIGADIWYCLCMQDLVAGSDWWDWLGGKMCSMWFVILSLFFMFYAGKFAVKRLIMNYKPPEVEKN
jgi:hypothetical protein